MKKNKIVLEADRAELVDHGAREYCTIIDRKLKNINERTKRQTIQIREMDKKIKEVIEEYEKSKSHHN